MMEEASPVKLSVAELAGKFKSHPLPIPKNDEKKPVGRSPPSSLQLQDQMVSEGEKEKATATPPPPPKAKLKSSPLIEKLQANPILSPNILFNSTKGPEGKQHGPPFCPINPFSPTLRPPQQHGANEVPISFDQPAEGTTLPSFNKSRVRLAVKRRPPSRQHRKSACEDGSSDTSKENMSPCDLHSPDKNGSTKDALNVAPEEIHKGQEISTPVIIVQDIELQEDHGNMTKDTEGTDYTEGKNKEKDAKEECSGNPEALGATDNQQEKEALEQNTEETEGSTKEEHSAEPPEKIVDTQDQEQAFRD